MREPRIYEELWQSERKALRKEFDEDISPIKKPLLSGLVVNVGLNLNFLRR